MTNWLKQQLQRFFSRKLAHHARTTMMVQEEKDMPLSTQSPTDKEQGDAALGCGDFVAAAACYRRAIAANPNSAMAYCDLGYALMQQGLGSDAQSCVSRAISIDPTIPDAHYLAGMLAQARGELEKSCSYFQRALELAPDFEGVYLTLCVALFQSGQLENAKNIIRQGIDKNPGNADFHYYLGNLYNEEHHYELAMASYRAALSINPDHAEVCANLGLVHLKMLDYDQAITALTHATLLNPASVDAWVNLGSALQGHGRLEAALESFRRAVEIKPDHVQAYSNMGVVLRELGRLDEAIESYERALAINPDLAELHSNLGDALRGLGRYAAAIASARKALQINPGLTDVKKFLGALLLFVGEFDEGWTLYQSPPEAVNELQEWMRLNADFSQWQGQSLNGKSLLVYCEQGLGDQIQLCRYAPILKELGAMRITVLCMKPLENLFKRVAGIDEVITGWEIVHLRKHDYWIGSFGIPLHCKTQLDTIPVSIPYLYADAMREKNMATHFADIAEFKVGICWKGSKAYGRDDERSLTLEPFKKIFDLPGARFFTLMVDSRDEFFAAADKAAVDLGHEIDADAPPFEETAALIMNLDLVIACDTSIAHLAGALGKPVWIVLPFSPDWRWLEDRADSPWYPTIRLFRQRTRGDWNELFDRVAIRLQSVIVGKLPVVWPLDGD